MFVVYECGRGINTNPLRVHIKPYQNLMIIIEIYRAEHGVHIKK